MPARVADGLGTVLVNVGPYVDVDGVDVLASTPGSTSSAISRTSMCSWQAHSLRCCLKQLVSRPLREDVTRAHHALKHWLKPLNALPQEQDAFRTVTGTDARYSFEINSLAESSRYIGCLISLPCRSLRDWTARCCELDASPVKQTWFHCWRLLLCRASFAMVAICLACANVYYTQKLSPLTITAAPMSRIRSSFFVSITFTCTAQLS